MISQMNPPSIPRVLMLLAALASTMVKWSFQKSLLSIMVPRYLQVVRMCLPEGRLRITGVEGIF